MDQCTWESVPWHGRLGRPGMCMTLSTRGRAAALLDGSRSEASGGPAHSTFETRIKSLKIHSVTHFHIASNTMLETKATRLCLFCEWRR